jgi:glycosyltransferase involved in cell wall biosynthesis
MQIALLTRIMGASSGVTLSAWDVAVALNESGNNLHLITADGGSVPKSIDGYSLENIPRYMAPKGEAFPNPVNFTGMRRWAESAIFDSARHRRLGELKPQLFFVNGLNAHRFFSPIRKLAGENSILIVRESLSHLLSRAKQESHNAGEKILAHPYRIFVSELVQKEWTDYLQLDPARNFYIPNCIRESEANALLKQNKSELRRKLGFSEKSFHIVNVSSIQPRKGQDLIIAQMEEIFRLIPNAILHFVGPLRGNYAKDLLQQVKQSSFSQKVIFHGQVSPALPMIYAADTFLLSSRGEALPRVILEAMALGIPVVSSDVDGIPELVIHGKNGFLFPVSQPEQISAFLSKLAQNSQLRQQFAEASQRRYHEKFSRKLQIDRYAALIKTIGGNR